MGSITADMDGLLTTIYPSSSWSDDNNTGDLITKLVVNASSVNFTAAPPPDETPYKERLAYTIFFNMYKYGILVLGAIGTVGNILALMVLSRKNFRNTATSVFLRMLAVADTITLWGYVLWVIRGLFVRSITNFTTCKVVFYILSCTPHVSSYTLLNVAIERLVAVVWPLHVREIFTKKRAYIICLVTVVVPFIYNIFQAWFIKYDAERGLCNYRDKDRAKVAEWSKFDASIGIVIPAVSICVVNIITLVVFRKSQQTKKMMTKAKETKNIKIKNDNSTTNHLTVMLITIALVYWLLNSLSAGMFIAQRMWHPNTQNQLLTFWVLHMLSYVLMVANNAINFFLYILTGRRFREELKAIFVYRKEKAKPINSASFSTVCTEVSSTG